MNKISVDWAGEIVEGAVLVPKLEEVFGAVSEDVDWRWAAFQVPGELGGGWVPCGWSEIEKVLMGLDLDLCECFDDGRIREVFRAMNPSLSDSELDNLQTVGREILDRSAYHRVIPKGTFDQEEVIGKSSLCSLDTPKKEDKSISPKV